MERTLDALSLRQRVTAHNVANLDSPGYKPFRVTFEDALSEALAAGDRGEQTADFPVRVMRSNGGRVREDGNGVDIDREMVSVAKTTIAYNAVAQQWSGMYGRMHLAVREGRR